MPTAARQRERRPEEISRGVVLGRPPNSGPAARYRRTPEGCFVRIDFFADGQPEGWSLPKRYERIRGAASHEFLKSILIVVVSKKPTFENRRSRALHQASL